MKYISLVFISTMFHLLAFCQNEVPDRGVGIITEYVDSSVVKKIVILNTGEGKIIMFPPDYFTHTLGGYRGSTEDKKAYFMPDTLTLLHMNEDLKLQYCDALCYRVNVSLQFSKDHFWKKMSKQRRKEEEASFTRWLNYIDSTCNSQTLALDSMYKQVQAYKSDKYKGEVLYIQLLDFREDPYNLKERSKRQIIDGWHGWFETNIEGFYYNIKQRKLSVHGDNF